MDTLTATPDEATRAAFRRCVGMFATGVCIVTTEHDDHAAGMTLNSFASVSLDPLLVLVSLAHESRTLAAVVQSKRFAVNFLRRDQRAVAAEFATHGGAFPMHRVQRANGYLTVPGALGWVTCELAEIVRAGDHAVVFGRVAEFTSNAGDPLVFHAGKFGGGIVVDEDMSISLPLFDEEVGW